MIMSRLSQPSQPSLFTDDLQPAVIPRLQLPPEVLQVIGYLSRHCRGFANARTAARIGRELGWTGSDIGLQVRRAISLHYHDLPFIVCSGQRGFFISSDPADATHERRSLHSRLRCLALRIRALDRVAARAGLQRSGSGPHAMYHSPDAS